MQTTAPRIRSLGSACQLLQVRADKFQRAASDLGILPVQFIDDVPHFADTDVERVRDQLKKKRSK